MTAFFKAALFINFFGLCISACLGLLQIEHWFLQLFTHFVFQYVWLFVLFGILFFIIKKNVFGILSILFAIILFSKIWPASSLENKISTSNHTLSVLSINLLSSNTNVEKVNRLITEKDADILVLIEYTSFWDRNAAVKEYPYSIDEVREDNFGIALYSKYPFKREGIIDFTNSRFPMASTQIKIGNEPLDILGLHYENPIGHRQKTVQKVQIQETIAFAQKSDKILIVGDFNLTPYTKDFSRLLNEASLKDSRVGFGIQGSWPAFWSPFRIPIDHALLSKNIHIKHREIGPSVGSDHLPLYLEIQL